MSFHLIGTGGIEGRFWLGCTAFYYLMLLMYHGALMLNEFGQCAKVKDRAALYTVWLVVLIAVAIRSLTMQTHGRRESSWNPQYVEQFVFLSIFLVSALRLTMMVRKTGQGIRPICRPSD